MMPNVIAIVGPTGVGKTKYSIALATHLNAEIISCDSMQFYRGLDIGTAKISKPEMQGIPHHLLDILNPEEEFSVAEYQRVVRQKIEELLAQDITPILVGGSGLYISSVLYNYQFKDEKRNEEEPIDLTDKSLEELVEMLEFKSPKLANKTDLDNRRRVLRALEKEENDLDTQGNKLYYKGAKIIGFEMDRTLLYERINKRVDLMIEKGLLEEAKQLFDKHIHTQATMAIGYKELFEYFEGRNSLDESIELIKRNSRRYAKRQMTWFKNKMNCFWINVDFDNYDAIIEEVISYSI